MTLREIKGFPMYKMDIETGEVHGPGRHGRGIIKKTRRQTMKGERSLFINLCRDGKVHVLTWYRLRYAVEHGICYEDIPKDLHVLSREDGSFYLATKQEHMELTRQYMREKRQRERLQRIDEKMRELEIMRRAYTEGSHIEAVQYIETRKPLLVAQCRKRHGIKPENAELVYSLALEKMIDAIDSPCSQVKELTVSMMGLMSKAWTKLQRERLLRHEVARLTT